MLKNGTGIQGSFNANLPSTMIGVPNGPWTPTAIKSMFIDPSQGGVEFLPGVTFVSRNDKGLIIRGLGPNSNLLGVVMRGASKEALNESGAGIVFKYEDKGPVPVGTTVTTWIQVVSAPSKVETNGIAINNETGQATAYDNSATAGYFTTGVVGYTVEELKAIVDGSLTVGVNGGAAANVPDLDFSAITDFDDAAAVLEAALTGVYVNYNTAEGVFVFTSATESAASAIAITAGTTGTNLFPEAALNAENGTATAGTAAGSPPAGYTAAPGIGINRWSAQEPTKVEISLPVVNLV